jgi:hypothetical protein
MKQITLITALVLIQTFSFGQNLFFIGEKSYPCTETIMLESNASFLGKDLDVLIAKDNEKGLIVVSTYIVGGGVRIKGKIIIYLDDGTVITCIDRNEFDFVDNVATTIYYLTNDELNKMKNSNINTIRFTLKCQNCVRSSEEGSFSASNKEKTDVQSSIINLFN